MVRDGGLCCGRCATMRRWCVQRVSPRFHRRHTCAAMFGATLSSRVRENICVPTGRDPEKPHSVMCVAHASLYSRQWTTNVVSIPLPRLPSPFQRPMDQNRRNRKWLHYSSLRRSASSLRSRGPRPTHRAVRSEPTSLQGPRCRQWHAESAFSRSNKATPSLAGCRQGASSGKEPGGSA